jgi:hypothetical protein
MDSAPSETQQIPQGDTSGEPRQRVLVFFSADLADSTPLKSPIGVPPEGAAGAVEALPSWQDQIDGFLKNFRRHFDDEMKQVFCNHGFQQIKLTFFKSIGDELVYYVQPSEPLEACASMRAFLDALAAYNKETEGKLDPRVKGTAWLVGLPVNNHEVELFSAISSEPLGSTGSATLSISRDPRGEDFAGPSMDCGFRAAKFSSAARVTVPPDLALVLLQEAYREKFGFEFSYLGRQSLKGVLGGLPVPLVSVHTTHPELDDQVRGNKCLLPTEANSLEKLCWEFTNTTRDRSWMIPPYFRGAPSLEKKHVFTSVPPWHERRFKELQTKWERKKLKHCRSPGATVSPSALALQAKLHAYKPDTDWHSTR